VFSLDFSAARSGLTARRRSFGLRPKKQTVQQERNTEHPAKLSKFDMKTDFNESLHWTDQFVENGFAIAKGLVDPELHIMIATTQHI
jgi:hypothetical protein